MTRILILALFSASLAACASTNGGDAMPGLANSAFDYAPARSERHAVQGFGYELAGAQNWSGSLVYEASGDIPAAILSYDNSNGERTEAELAIAMPYLEDGVRRFHGLTDTGEPVDVELQVGRCQVVDPDDPQLYFVAMRVGESVYSGCGSEVAATDRWSNYLLDYLPAIDTCLAEFRGEEAYVSVAYTMPGGETAIRVVDSDVRTWECATREQGTAINSIRPLDAADAVFGEGDPIFVRGIMPAFGEGCYVYEAVREADGSLIGAFGHDSCDVGGVAAREPDAGVG